MAIFLSENDYTPLQLATYIKNTSTLRTEDFTINNTGIYYSENKTVVDNAIDMGYQVENLMNQKTRVNLLYSHPSDGKPFWVYGRTLNAATNHLLSFTSSAYTTVFILTMSVTLLVLL